MRRRGRRELRVAQGGHAAARHDAHRHDLGLWCHPHGRPRGGSFAPGHRQALAPHVWIHTSYRDIPPWGAIPTHGLVVEVDGQRVLVDTAWTEDQTAEILRWSSPPISVAVVTHAHDDKMGGIPALHAAGIDTYAHPLSNADAPERGLTPARHALAFEEAATSLFEGALEIFYPGGGHTRDNIVVYLPVSRVLFGGCLIRPGDADGLGNTADADVAHWAEAVRSVQRRFPEAAIVVPSHGDPGGVELLEHTAALAEAR